MPELARIKVSLRIFGDTLDPREVTRVLGVEPTASARKGDVVRRTASGREVIAQSGAWHLVAEGPGNLNMRISALFAKLPDDFSVWHRLSEFYRCDVFCGLFLEESNEGTSLRSETLSLLGDRGLTLHLDIYYQELNE